MQREREGTAPEPPNPYEITDVEESQADHAQAAPFKGTRSIAAGDAGNARAMGDGRMVFQAEPRRLGACVTGMLQTAETTDPRPQLLRRLRHKLRERQVAAGPRVG